MHCFWASHLHCSSLQPCHSLSAQLRRISCQRRHLNVCALSVRQVAIFVMHSCCAFSRCQQHLQFSFPSQSFCLSAQLRRISCQRRHLNVCALSVRQVAIFVMHSCCAFSRCQQHLQFSFPSQSFCVAAVLSAQLHRISCQRRHLNFGALSVRQLAILVWQYHSCHKSIVTLTC